MVEPQRLKRPTVYLFGATLGVTLLFVFLFHEALEEPVLKLAGFFIGSVNNNQRRFAALVATAFVSVWAVIGVICWLERPRSEG